MVPQTQNEAVFKRMRLAICSGNRRRVLLALHQKKKSLGDLREDLNSDSPTILRSLRELERNRMVQQDELRDYSLTVIGEAIAQKVINCHHLAEVLTLHEAFWFEHDVSGIPEYCLVALGYYGVPRSLLTRRSTF
jgi:predicted transcriptional regulator